jgi:hypothetical protein
VAALTLLAVALPDALQAQDGATRSRSLFVGVAGARSTYNEVSPENEHSGWGGTATARYQRSKWAVEGEVSWRSLSPDSGEGESLTLMGGALFGRYDVWRTLAVEAGFDSRTFDPEFGAQDVGAATVGLRYETPLASLATLWVRGAAIPWSSFNGGGEAGLGMALGLGVRAGPADARWRAVVSYDFQRIDRSVDDVDVPIQYEGLRIGIEIAAF